MRISGVLLVFFVTLCSAQKHKAERDHRNEGKLSSQSGADCITLLLQPAPKTSLNTWSEPYLFMCSILWGTLRNKNVHLADFSSDLQQSGWTAEDVQTSRWCWTTGNTPSWPRSKICCCTTTTPCCPTTGGEDTPSASPPSSGAFFNTRAFRGQRSGTELNWEEKKTKSER